MTQPRPELITVAGHEKGHRAVLMENDSLIGRSRQCQIQFMEPYISRHQARLRLMPDGWMIENVSPTVIRINGKKLKEGGKAFLDTGDVISLGAATDVLFVNAGHDPEAAVIAYERTHPASVEPIAPLPIPPSLILEAGSQTEQGPAGQETLFAPVGSAPRPPARPVDSKGVLGKLAAAPVAVMGDNDDAEPLTPVEDEDISAADIAAEERRAKLKKYGIMFGVYLAVVAGIIVLLMTVFKAEPPEERTQASVLGRGDIEQMLRENYENREAQPLRARELLATARNYYGTRLDDRGGLFLAIEYYRLAEAYGGENGDYTLSVEDETQYVDAVNQLVEAIWPRYDRACRLARDQRWEEADELFDEIMEYLPPSPEGGNVHELVENVRGHLNYVNRRLYED